MKNILRLLANNFLRVGGRLEQLSRTPPAYMDDIPSRDVLIKDIYAKMDAGVPWRKAMQDQRASEHSERVVEYSYILAKVREIKPKQLLDVGCVMNNPIIDQYIPKECHVSFLNPALEPIVRSNATYHRSPMEDFVPTCEYDMVTCLSTIEHIGFDNTRYGTTITDQGWDWERTIREFLDTLDRLRRLAPPQAPVIVSLPYGQKEFVRLPPVIGPRVWQVAHSEHIQASANDPRLQGTRLTVLKLEGTGWRLSQPEEAYEPFGAVGTAASGVLIIEMNGVGGSSVV